MITLYRFLSILFAPLIDAYLWIRKLNHKEDPLRFKERSGYASCARPKGSLIWLHCASVGESNSAIPLINKLLADYPKAHILFTSGTTSSAKEIAKKLPARVIHQFVPVDKFFSVKRFLSHWQPDFAIFVESEIWPNLISLTRKSGCKMALINARISEKSYKNWIFWHKFGFNILKNFDICFAQSKKDQERFRNLGLESYFEGNLKSICVMPEIDLNKLNNLKNLIGKRKVWLAASTHRGEEELIIKTHLELKKNYPDILTIIAPRHPKRKNEITSLIPSSLSYQIRSEDGIIADSTDIYIADTLGELGLFYNLAGIALVGGSLIDNIGGHTPYEAIKSGCVPISGSYVANFEEVYEQLKESKSCLIAINQIQLVKDLLNLLSDNILYLSILENGKKVMNSNYQILEKIINKLDLKV